MYFDAIFKISKTQSRTLDQNKPIPAWSLRQRHRVYRIYASWTRFSPNTVCCKTIGKQQHVETTAYNKTRGFPVESILGTYLHKSWPWSTIQSEPWLRDPRTRSPRTIVFRESTVHPWELHIYKTYFCYSSTIDVLKFNLT